MQIFVLRLLSEFALQEVVRAYFANDGSANASKLFRMSLKVSAAPPQVQGSLLFVTYTIIQGIIGSEMLVFFI